MAGPLLSVFPALKRAARAAPRHFRRGFVASQGGVIGNLWGSGQISSWMVASPDRPPVLGSASG
jgi:hypothetical protein